jgi:hypothetical protein
MALTFFSRVSSVEGKGHWWDSVLNDKEVNLFLQTAIKLPRQIRDEQDHFSIVTTNPASTGTVHGIQIEQLSIPYR